MPSLHQHICRGILSLNNMGVTMLDRHCYEQGHETLKDVARAMKILASHQCPGTTTNAATLSVEELARTVTQQVHLAEQRLANPQYSLQRLTIEVVSQDAGLSCVFDTTLTHVHHPIRIDMHEMNPSCWHCFSHDLLCAIVVYNTGVSYLCQVQQIVRTQRTMIRNRLIDMAVRLFTLSDNCVKLCEDIADDRIWTLFVSILVKQSLGIALRAMGKLVEAFECILVVEEQQRLLEELLEEDFRVLLGELHSPAAAA